MGNRDRVQNFLCHFFKLKAASVGSGLSFCLWSQSPTRTKRVFLLQAKARCAQGGRIYLYVTN